MTRPGESQGKITILSCSFHHYLRHGRQFGTKQYFDMCVLRRHLYGWVACLGHPCFLKIDKETKKVSSMITPIVRPPHRDWGCIAAAQAKAREELFDENYPFVNNGSIKGKMTNLKSPPPQCLLSKDRTWVLCQTEHSEHTLHANTHAKIYLNKNGSRIFELQWDWNRSLIANWSSNLKKSYVHSK